jgi:hypothetical protein
MESVTVFLLILLWVISASKAIHAKFSRQWFRGRKASSAPFTSLESAPPIPAKEVTLKDTPLYILPALQPKGSSPTSMGLKRLESANWLTMDDNYSPEHTLRNSLLTTNYPQVVQCLEGSEEACHEVLELVTEFLSTRYPQQFTTSDTPLGPIIHNHLTNESFQIGSDCKTPLETASRLAMEDFNILIKNPDTGDHHLMASATLFPAGWKLEERIGFSIAKLHAPVPEWKKNLAGSVNR